MQERYELFIERINEIVDEDRVREPFNSYFKEMASFVVMLSEAKNDIDRGCLESMSMDEHKAFNRKLYEDILPDNYAKSYGNPSYAVMTLGSELGAYLSFLYEQLRAIIPFMYEDRLKDINIILEVFLQVYSAFVAESEEGLLPDGKSIKDILYYFVSDYADVIIPDRIHQMVNPDEKFMTDIIIKSDLSDLRYLYKYGEYISEDEIKTAKFINSLPQDLIDKMASVYTEGYRIGFIQTGKDLSKKSSVEIRCRVGYERVIRKAIDNFSDMGLKSIIFRNPSHACTKVFGRTGMYGSVPNKQFDYDHRNDNALFLDKAFADRRVELTREAFEENKKLAAGYAGPAVMLVYGENPFSPIAKDEVLELSKKQQTLKTELSGRLSELTNQYIKGEERSFTIIAWPSPQIGEKYEEIFYETIKLNTLDYITYRDIQQKIILALDPGKYAHIKGMGENKTDLYVSLRDNIDIEKQTQFENCVADVNIPVGEVFTSPVLKGTNGTLHVSEVYLDGLKFENLTIAIKDGMIENYTCANFDNEEENKKYIVDNILYNHKTLPMGEFAIGTNTTAYAMAKKYDIFDRLDILIAEKTGPHFAFGDTCYSYAEDIAVFNPDGREIISRDNEVSAQRKTDPAKAYFHCHTDITIPYDELGKLSVIYPDGKEVAIIDGGKFVLDGTEELNKPL